MDHKESRILLLSHSRSPLHYKPASDDLKCATTLYGLVRRDAITKKICYVSKYVS